MRLFLAILLSSIFFMQSCQKKDNSKKNTIKKTAMSIAVTHTRAKKLNNYSIKEIKKWKEYFIVEDFIHQLDKTTPTEALNNAIELKTLSKHLKDSLNVKDLMIPSFKARIHVFENEVLRLADMTYIPSISATDVNNQVEKVLTIFSSLNAKINTLYDKKRFDSEINIDSIFNQ